ncbi:MAG: SDR family NAD(P)-dependent oxidoreductase, partial [Clostridium sp.]|nr:SDR family NAD(P)-dependent oxidoreductase [Clostridium sp.]
MSTYVITGGTTGIGAATRKLLLSQGHEVFNIDFKGGDHLADLSSPEGRQSAVDEVFRRYPDGIDVLICNAGVGPTAPPQTIFALNFFASVRIAEALRPLLKKKHGNCVITSSNSVTNMTVRMEWV